jgi:hypothetical protein
MECALFSFEPCRLTTKSLILHMIDCWIHHNETPLYILSSHYQYTRVPWVLGLTKLWKLPLFTSWWSIGHWMEGDHAQPPPLWIFRLIILMKPKKTETPNLVIWVTRITKYSKKITKYLVIWLFGYLGHPNNQIFGYSVIQGDQNNQPNLVIWLFGWPK